VINDMVDACDVFVLVMSRVWGRPATDSPIGVSYTEEEFKRAAARFSSTGNPEIVCFFKQIPLDALADPGESYAKALDIKPLGLTEGQIVDLVQFLEALTSPVWPDPSQPSRAF
jgi:hypothetical protein